LKVNLQYVYTEDSLLSFSFLFFICVIFIAWDESAKSLESQMTNCITGELEGNTNPRWIIRLANAVYLLSKVFIVLNRADELLEIGKLNNFKFIFDF